MSIKSSISQRCKIATDCLPASPFKTKLEALHIEMLRFIKAKAPAWHDAPTVPGDWVIVVKGYKHKLQTGITQQEIDHVSEWPGRWYGPLPEDDGGKT